MLEYGVRAAGAVDMTEHGAAKTAARPVVAGQVHVSGQRAAFHARAGQRIVPVRRHSEARDHRASFGQRIFPVELVVVTVKIIDVLRDGSAFEILPGTAPDAVA